MDAVELIARACARERRWLARAITRIELRDQRVGQALVDAPVRRRVGPGAPHVIGVTGPPGAGKSTFVDQLVREARAAQRSVAVIAVDPSSPFSGGAILGDRIRMEGHASDDGVYVRSLSARGSLGGLSTATDEVVDLLDAAGFDLILLETVGVGQSELGVMEVADTTIVVLTPESGDTVQTMKAGLLEIADLFVVNKADRPGAAGLARELRSAVALDEHARWPAPVLEACALEGRGVSAVATQASAHLAWLKGDGGAFWRERRADAAIHRTLDLVAERARTEAARALGNERASLADALRTGRVRPHQAAEQL